MTPTLNVLKETIKRLIYKGNYRALERILEKSHKGDIVAIFRYLSHHEKIKTFQILMDVDIEKASDVLYDLDEDLQLEILRSLPLKEAVRILLTFSTGEIAKIIDKLPDELQKHLLEKLEEEEREELEKYISYGESSVASLISEDFISVFEERTVEEVLSIIKTAPEDIEIVYIYVTDKKERLVGVTSIKEILTAPGSVQIKDIMESDVISIKSNATKEEAIDIFRRYDLFILPVVDEEDVLIGVIYIDDILDAITEKTTEDIFKMAGAQEEELFYTNQIIKIAKLRLPWLLVSVFGEIITAFIISIFDFTIKEFLPIIFFLPLLAAISGNISSQSAIIISRGLVTGKIMESFKDFLYYLYREVKVAIVLAFIISGIVGVIATLWLSHHIMGMVISLAIFINMVLAAFSGGLLPYILLRMNRDPLLATGPIVLTVNDIFGILIYLGTATFFLQYLKL
ncbi:MAG TPA: magnesium transporter [Persephonella sp.]|uniref:Magnesium transporter MgtE n=1 Tax=Persephonella marina (strain DSM 14350 / EX-H1) TaxID=123214 RepID=C0QUR9_PERMH|nr:MULTISPECIES: magnesium transporter [Persephonella]ACO03803.1 magnesium transporter [Persephonella marina EX-H1]HCB69950.1 magnesium transporter [Persephonella sp.]